MKTKYFYIGHIPAILFGDETKKLIIAIHGNMSHKEDDAIVILAEEAVKKGYQVLSFDMPQHGDRKEELLNNVEVCITELNEVMKFAKSIASDINLFACSQGAYFALQAFKNEYFNKALFLSPVVDMRILIENIMVVFNISVEQLAREKEVPTPIGITLYKDYYSFVANNPIEIWGNKTSVLYGENDNVVDRSTVETFVNRCKGSLDIMKNGEHYFNNEEQRYYFRDWIKREILK